MALATRPRPKAHELKRQGGHHRHSKRYLNSYWPYLPMLLIVGLGLLVNSAWSSRGVLGVKSDFSASSLLHDTNAQRAGAGEQALTLNGDLSAAAQAKADDMVRSNYWAHTSPTGKTPWAFITASGYRYQSAGENLAYGFASAAASVTGWMNSPEHRDNILNSGYRDVGFGVASSPDFIGQGPETVVVAEYGQPAAGAVNDNGIEVAPQTGAPSSNVLGADFASQPVSRIQLLTGQEWALLAVITLTGAAMAAFILRHGYRLHRLMIQGESFVNKHPYLDITVVLIITAGCVLTRVGGIVR